MATKATKASKAPATAKAPQVPTLAEASTKKKGEDGQVKLTPQEQTAALAGLPIMSADTEPKQWDWHYWMDDEDNRNQLMGQMWLLVGQTQTGKSWFVRDLLYRMRNLIPFGWIFSHTKHNNFWRQYFPNHLIIPRYNDKFVRAIIELQKGRSKHKGLNNHVVIILDDVASEALRFEKTLIELAMEGRHYNITTIFTTQHFTKATTAMRANAWWTVIFTTQHLPTLEYMFDEWMGINFVDKHHMHAFISKNTQDHQAVVVHRHPYIEMADKYWVHKADDLDDTTFALLNDRAWGGPKAQMAEMQRVKYPLPQKYSKSYLKQLFQKSRIKFDDVVRHRDDQHAPWAVIDDVPGTGGGGGGPGGGGARPGFEAESESAPRAMGGGGRRGAGNMIMTPFGPVKRPTMATDELGRPAVDGRPQWRRAMDEGAIDVWRNRGVRGGAPDEWQWQVGVDHGRPIHRPDAPPLPPRDPGPRIRPPRVLPFRPVGGDGAGSDDDYYDAVPVWGPLAGRANAYDEVGANAYDEVGANAYDEVGANAYDAVGEE